MAAYTLKAREWETLAKKTEFQPAKLARAVAVTPRQLQRIFQNEFHTTPGHWLRHLQCRHAREMLAEGFSNKDVANALHFSNASHMCREFKKAFGISPQKFALQSSKMDLQTITVAFRQ